MRREKHSRASLSDVDLNNLTIHLCILLSDNICMEEEETIMTRNGERGGEGERQSIHVQVKLYNVHVYL